MIVFLKKLGEQQKQIVSRDPEYTCKKYVTHHMWQYYYAVSLLAKWRESTETIFEVDHTKTFLLIFFYVGSFYPMVLLTFFKVFQFSTNQKHWMMGQVKQTLLWKRSIQYFSKSQQIPRDCKSWLSSLVLPLVS